MRLIARQLSISLAAFTIGCGASFRANERQKGVQPDNAFSEIKSPEIKALVPGIVALREYGRLDGDFETVSKLSNKIIDQQDAALAESSKRIVTNPIFLNHPKATQKELLLSLMALTTQESYQALEGLSQIKIQNASYSGYLVEGDFGRGRFSTQLLSFLYAEFSDLISKSDAQAIKDRVVVTLNNPLLQRQRDRPACAAASLSVNGELYNSSDWLAQIKIAAEHGAVPSFNSLDSPRVYNVARVDSRGKASKDLRNPGDRLPQDMYMVAGINASEISSEPISVDSRPGMFDGEIVNSFTRCNRIRAVSSNLADELSIKAAKFFAKSQPGTIMCADWTEVRHCGLFFGTMQFENTTFVVFWNPQGKAADEVRGTVLLQKSKLRTVVIDQENSIEGIAMSDLEKRKCAVVAPLLGSLEYQRTDVLQRVERTIRNFEAEHLKNAERKKS